MTSVNFKRKIRLRVVLIAKVTISLTRSKIMFIKVSYVFISSLSSRSRFLVRVGVQLPNTSSLTLEQSLPLALV